MNKTQTDRLSSYSTWVLNQGAGSYISKDSHMVKILFKLHCLYQWLNLPWIRLYSGFLVGVKCCADMSSDWTHKNISFFFSFWHLQEVVSSSSGESWAPSWWFFFLGGVRKVENHWFSMHTQHCRHHSYKICYLEELKCSNKTSMSPVYIANKCPYVHFEITGRKSSLWVQNLRTWDHHHVFRFFSSVLSNPKIAVF